MRSEGEWQFVVVVGRWVSEVDGVLLVRQDAYAYALGLGFFVFLFELLKHSQLFALL